MTMPKANPSFPVHWLVLAGVLSVTLLVYWVGLDGPLLMDDFTVIKSVSNWATGGLPLQGLLFGNTSLLTDRALSMATLAANAAWLGDTPRAYKLGNLLVHLACGIVAYGWLSALLARDPMLATRRRIGAALLAAVWLLHPINVSTVLYAVQRMAQTATLFTLLGLWLFVHARTRMQEQARSRDLFYLFAGIPVLTFLGVQGKQNAAVLPLLCLVIELAYFQRPREWPKAIRTFFGIFVAAPIVAVLAALLFWPTFLFGDYGLYEFGPVERLLSQARALSDYLCVLLIPSPPGMGVYTDDFAVSTGLLSPPTTALALAALLALSIAAWRTRTAQPSVFAGWFIFLVGHAVESSLLPLELYYEHRNYLPAFGVLLAVAGLTGPLMRRLDALGIRSARIGVVAIAALLGVLALQTHGRARVWGDAATLATSALHSHPNSVRAHLGYLSIAATNEPAVYRRALDASLASTNQRVRASALMFQLIVNCEKHEASTPADLRAVVAAYPPHIDIMESIGFRTLAELSSGRGCPGLTDALVADAIVSVVDRAVAQPESTSLKWPMRNDAARLYARSGNWAAATEQAGIAWEHSSNAGIAEVLILARLQAGDIEGAEALYREALVRGGRLHRYGPAYQQLRRTIDRYRAGRSPAHEQTEICTGAGCPSRFVHGDADQKTATARLNLPPPPEFCGRVPCS